MSVAHANVARPETRLETHTLTASDGVRLACRASGAPGNPPVVFVHGYPDNHRVWDRVVARLENEFRCIRYDVRGAGESAAPRRTAAYRLARLAADLAAVIAWASPDAPVHVVGHDWGSIQSWEAATNPVLAERIASFTSISGPCLDHAGHWLRAQWRNNRAALLQQLGKSWYIAAFHLPIAPALVWHAVLGRVWPRLLQRLEGVRLPVGHNVARDGSVGVRLYRANVLARLVRPRERHAQMPVQAITPRRDAFVGPGFAEELDRWVADLTVTPIDAAHWAVLTHPRTIADACRRFMRAHKSTAPRNAPAQTAKPRIQAPD